MRRRGEVRICLWCGYCIRGFIANEGVDNKDMNVFLE